MLKVARALGVQFTVQVRTRGVDRAHGSRLVLLPSAGRRRHHGLVLDYPCIVHAAIDAPASAGELTPKDISRAIKQYKIDVDKIDPALA